MKNIIGFAAVLIFCLSLILLNSPPKKQVLTAVAEHPGVDYVTEYNLKVNKIKTFTADIEASNDVTAKIVYDKINNQVHFSAFSRMGKEMDIGTNKDVFWFWSRRFDSKLYYSPKDQISKCNLKPQFNPNFFIKTLGFEPIKNNIKTDKGQLAFEELDKMVYLCEINDYAQKHYLYDNNKIIAYAQVLEMQEVDGFVVPKTMELIFPEENLSVKWTFKNIKINTLEGHNWNLPDITPKIIIGS